MKRVLIELDYRANDQYDNKFYDGLLKLNECISQIDDLFITNVDISNIEEVDEQE